MVKAPADGILLESWTRQTSQYMGWRKSGPVPMCQYRSTSADLARQIDQLAARPREVRMIYRPCRRLMPAASDLFGVLLAVILLAVIGTGLPAHQVLADDGCLPAPGINASIDKFIDDVQAVQQSGQGTLPVADALFGVTDINANDQQALAGREPIKLTRQESVRGSFTNRGPKRITVNGIFATRPTFFQIPKLVSGRYISTKDSLTLIYDDGHAVKVGERFLGMSFSKIVNHTVITRTKLSYFFESNSGDTPDRCYDLTAK
jgi:hypothetical protein